MGNVEGWGWGGRGDGCEGKGDGGRVCWGKRGWGLVCVSGRRAYADLHVTGPMCLTTNDKQQGVLSCAVGTTHAAYMATSLVWSRRVEVTIDVYACTLAPSGG